MQPENSRKKALSGAMHAIRSKKFQQNNICNNQQKNIHPTKIYMPTYRRFIIFFAFHYILKSNMGKLNDLRSNMGKLNDSTVLVTASPFYLYILYKTCTCLVR